jgi:hypothetical protein
MLDICQEVSSIFTKNSNRMFRVWRKSRSNNSNVRWKKNIGKYIKTIYIRTNDERNYIRWNSFSEETESDRIFMVPIRQFNQNLGFMGMLFNLSFDLLGFWKKQGNRDIADFKFETKKKYPTIYLNEHGQFKYVWDLFRTDWVIDNEIWKDDEYRKERSRRTWESMNVKRKILATIEWSIDMKVKKIINIIWNDSGFIKKNSENYWT